ncbi:MAG: glycosyltransferase family 4 protein [Chloroflexota bacterium]
MHIELIAEADKNITGLRRYTDTMKKYFARQESRTKIGMTFSDAPMPRLLDGIGRLTGKDLTTFIQHYPLRLKLPKADLYHLTSESLASVLQFQRIRPSIVTVHGLLTYLLRDDPELSMYNHGVERFVDALSVKGLAKADHLIAVSDYLRRALINDVGIPEDRITVVPEAVDHDYFRPVEVNQAFKDRYNLSDEFRYILYVGSEQPRKNFPMLIRAFARVHAKFPDIKLLKCGQAEVPAQREAAMKAIRETNMQEHVIFAGHVSDDLVYFYNYATVFAFPSKYEGFGFPPLEAMACGAPVISSNTASLPEVVNDAALLINPEDEDQLVDALRQMLASEETREEFRQRGLANAAQFDWNNTIEQTIAVYERVLGEKTTQSSHLRR